MEKLIHRKEQSQYLSLIVKKIAQDRLNRLESESYEVLKLIVDPSGRLEEELTLAWSEAEKMEKEKQNPHGFSTPYRKQFIGNLRYRFWKIFRKRGVDNRPLARVY